MDGCTAVPASTTAERAASMSAPRGGGPSQSGCIRFAGGRLPAPNPSANPAGRMEGGGRRSPDRGHACRISRTHSSQRKPFDALRHRDVPVLSVADPFHSWRPTMTLLEQTLNSTELRAEETRWYGAASGYVAWFLHHLRCIPASMWLAAADDETYNDTHDGSGSWLLEEQADYAARRRLHQAIESMPVVARRIRQ